MTEKIDHSIQTKQALGILDSITQDIPAEKRTTSYFVIECAQMLELQIGKGPEALKNLSRLELRDQSYAFVFLLRAPLPTVSRAVRAFVRMRDTVRDDGQGNLVPAFTREEVWDEFAVKYLDPFMAQISPDAIVEAYEKIEQLDDHVPLQAVPPENQKQDRPDPN